MSFQWPHYRADFFALCSCPPVWHGVIPPSCLVHNPPAPGIVWTTTSTTTEPVKRKKKGKGKRR